jgi:hypothetical protein
MIRIAISQIAFESIARTLPLGSVDYENQTNERGERRPQHPAVAAQRREAARRRREPQSALKAAQAATERADATEASA